MFSRERERGGGRERERERETMLNDEGEKENYVVPF